MIIETKEIYKCEYCRKLYQKKDWCEYHELTCSKRPDYLRACHSCSHLDKKNIDVFFDGYNGEYSERKSLLFCDKLNIFIHPPKVEKKGNAFELGDYANEPMKKECEFQDDNNIDRLTDKVNKSTIACDTEY